MFLGFESLGSTVAWWSISFWHLMSRHWAVGFGRFEETLLPLFS
jgi:hypothetical protein